MPHLYLFFLYSSHLFSMIIKVRLIVKEGRWGFDTLHINSPTTSTKVIYEKNYQQQQKKCVACWIRESFSIIIEKLRGQELLFLVGIIGGPIVVLNKETDFE